MIDNKYFVPAKEDLFIGYEYEERWNPNEPWLQRTIRVGEKIDYLNDLLNDRIGYCKGDKVRTKFLTKEQIEAEGWIVTENRYISHTWTTYNKGNWTVGYNTEKHSLAILMTDPSKELDYPHNCGIFRGECKSINEFRKILQYLQIK